ncbi:MAG: dethiobiotin synthase, partial [Alphaproteobacteria bacterium]|nr:dethiobiotin synthase [Alphaproteobacteria bacterium]
AQSGLADADDAAEVARLTGLPPARIHPFTYALQAPLSPHEAARREGVSIDMDRFSLPATGRPLVVEGAGGLLVPLNRDALMIDLIARLGLPVVLVGPSGLGTINHTLLSLEALRRRGLPVLGVILNGPSNPANRAAIERHGQIPVRELPRMDPLDADAVASQAAGLGDALKEPW